MFTEALSISVKRNTPSSPSIVRGKGCFLYDADGRAFLDMSGGSGAANLGYQRDDLIEVTQRQAELLVHTGWNIDNPHRHEVVAKLARLVPYPQASVFGAVTGAEAIEVALKIARAATGRQGVVYFDNAFHGKTQGALSVTSNPNFRKHLALGGLQVSALALDYAAEQDPARAAQWHEQLFAYLTQAKQAGSLPAAMIIEPIQAAEGMYPVPRPLLESIVELARTFGVISIFDEIYTGFGRTGKPFVSDATLLPDLLVLGKALGNGLPISAVVGRTELVDCLGYAEHSSTFTLMPLACAVASKVLDIFDQEQPWQLAASNGAHLRQALEQLGRDDERVTHVRGRGLMLAFDFAGDVLALRNGLLDHGVIVRTGGCNPNTVKLTPPIVMSGSEIQAFMQTLQGVCQAL
ncbi:aspartate aminotransferase family protein [Pseudomonas rubra]|uniref:Aspartate aminotransferase family protein n=1 Tax=Pseudomonas rubra TaxID=2942627 RepID=A0ABT5P334_9PSED|nr:aspartate aminotransferase family protein [Pseudomonas rubra]MDD1012695.1 aspartate aminotransferase family protein [Pseudomonas rubra]MDD1041597.1 aspartate aminotransferase family protein [Pseudomonas rubra]MDD1155533.1 aspartate aminotransferase family protein [Pseudomonas rubra]